MRNTVSRCVNVVGRCANPVGCCANMVNRCANMVGRSLVTPQGRSYDVGTVVEVGGVSRVEDDRLLVVCKSRVR